MAICEKCGKEFDYNETKTDFDEIYGYGEYSNLYGDFCFDCAEEELEDSSEALSIDDAADIWLANGMDEDYTFGYTEEELEAVLKK